MSASRAIAILIVAALPLMLAGYMKGKAAPAPDSHRHMKASLETLQKKLPASVTEVFKKALEGELKMVSEEEFKLKQLEVKVESARITGPSKARIIFSISVDAEIFQSFPFPSPIYCIAYLHYFDGQWTTTRIHPSSGDEKSALLDVALMLAIDRAGEK